MENKINECVNQIKQLTIDEYKQQIRMSCTCEHQIGEINLGQQAQVLRSTPITHSIPNWICNINSGVMTVIFQYLGYHEQFDNHTSQLKLINKHWKSHIESWGQIIKNAMREIPWNHYHAIEMIE